VKAYNICMLIIFINAAAFLLGSLGVFPGIDHTSFGAISALLGQSQFAILVVAGLMSAGTAVFLGTKIISSQGVAYGTFAALFWTSFVISAGIIRGIPLPGMELIFPIFTVACTMIFLVALIQMPTGGMKSHE